MRRRRSSRPSGNLDVEGADGGVVSRCAWRSGGPGPAVVLSDIAVPLMVQGRPTEAVGRPGLVALAVPARRGRSAKSGSAPGWPRIRQWPARLASRGPAAPPSLAGGPARRRTSPDGDPQNTAAMSWMRPGRDAAGRLGGERVDHEWVGRAAPVLGGGPAVTAEALDDPAPQVLAAAAVWAAGSAGSRWPRRSSWMGKRWSPPRPPAG